MTIDLTEIYSMQYNGPFARRLLAAIIILNEITKAGYEAYIAGGFVRDLVMFELEEGDAYRRWNEELEKSPRVYFGNYPTTTVGRLVELLARTKEGDCGFNDIDIATNMPLELLEKEYECKSNHGEAHGTILVLKEGFAFEVTQFRVDGEYTDGRHPDSIELAGSFKDDTARRDFTVNAMGMDKDGNIIDYHGGIDDLKNKLIRCVGNPEQRFGEDALRMLRAVRFAARFEFTIEHDTKVAILKCASGISKVAMERVWNEIEKVLKTADLFKIRSFVKLVDYTELNKYFDPDGFVNWKEASALIKRYANVFYSSSISETMAACMLFLPSGNDLAGKDAKNWLMKGMRHYRTTAAVMDRVIWFSTMACKLGATKFELDYFDNTIRYPMQTGSHRVTDLMDILEHRFGTQFIRIYPAIVGDYEHTFDTAISMALHVRDQIPTKAELVQSMQRVGVGRNQFRKVLQMTYEKMCRDAIGVRYKTDDQIDALVKEQQVKSMD